MAVITLMWPSFELTLTTVPGPAGSDQPSPIFSSWRPAMSRSHYRWRGQAGFNEWFRRLARYAHRFLVIDIIGFGRSVTGLLVSEVITFGSDEFNRSCLYRGFFIRLWSTLADHFVSESRLRDWPTTSWILNRDMIGSRL